NISSHNFEKNKESEGFPILIPAPEYAKSYDTSGWGARDRNHVLAEERLEHKMILGSCGKSDFQADTSRCFSNAEKGEPMSSFKKFYHYQYDENLGPVVQLRQNGKCILWNGTSTNCTTNPNIDAADGLNSSYSQFRLRQVDSPYGRTETFVQLQKAVQKPGDGTIMCYDVKGRKEVPCCNDPTTCGSTYAYMLQERSILDLTKSDSPNQNYTRYDLQFCTASSSTKQNLAYDCVDYVDPKWKLYQKIADAIGWVPILGSVPAYVLEGMVCNSGERTQAPGACMSLTVGLTLDVLLLPLDAMGFMGTFSDIAEQLVVRKAVKPTFGLMADFTTDPVLSSMAYFAAKRVVRQIEAKGMTKELTKEAIDKMTEPLTKAVLKRVFAGANGINGINPYVTFNEGRVQDLIKAAANTVRSGL
ncbi:MAG: hypothetical protein HQK54_05910, partial [Oligoflexales bacterium]|nr:hypothetical protein [Oligoflexales bacterium]